MALAVFGNIWKTVLCQVDGSSPENSKSFINASSFVNTSSGTCLSNSATSPHSSSVFCVFIRWIALVNSLRCHGASSVVTGRSSEIVLPANNVSNMSAKSFGCGGVVIVRTGCLSSERSPFHMRGFCKCSESCSDFQARNSCRCMRWISKDNCFRTPGSVVDFLACFFSINPGEDLKATHRFVQLPLCLPAFSSPASNDERPPTRLIHDWFPHKILQK